LDVGAILQQGELAWVGLCDVGDMSGLDVTEGERRLKRLVTVNVFEATVMIQRYVLTTYHSTL